MFQIVKHLYRRMQGWFITVAPLLGANSSVATGSRSWYTSLRSLSGSGLGSGHRKSGQEIWAGNPSRELDFRDTGYEASLAGLGTDWY